jgi:uncharacterized protein (TIGR02145 family)
MSISTFRTLAFVAFAVITAPLFSQGTCEIEGLFGPPPSSCGNPVTFDGYDYATVQIGDQCWFSENLRSDHYRNGDPIPVNLTNSEWSTTEDGAQAYYGYSPVNLSEYGRLYNWYAVDDARGLCPSGWHVPSDEAYTTLTDFLGGASVAIGKMKEAGTTHWNAPNTGADNSSGFTALGSGYVLTNGNFYGLQSYCGLWSSSPEGDYAWSQILDYSSAGVNRQQQFLRSGFSVRCLRD